MTADPLVAWLVASPWLTAPELAALSGVNPRTVRHRLARLVEAGRVRSLLVEVAPWPRARLHAIVEANDPLPPAPWRLVRLELLRALHALLVPLARPGGRPALVARLRGEAGGPPATDTPHPLAGLADAWLLDPVAGSGLLLRWDDGDRHDQVERGWLARLADLAPLAPPVAIVCATPAALGRWRDRLERADQPPALRLTLAVELAHVMGARQRTIWRDEHGDPAPPPTLTPLPLAWRATTTPPPPPRRLAALVAHRLALAAPDGLALRAIARQPLLTAPDLARRLACSERLAYQIVARLVERRLTRRLAPGEGTPGGRPPMAERPARPLWVTRAGLRLLAAMADEPPARFRHTTPLAGGAVARPGQPNGNRTLGRLARHPRHTADLIRLHEWFVAAVAVARRAGRPVVLLDWRGPVTAPIRFPTDDPRLIAPRPRWRRGTVATGADEVERQYGQVLPDAVARLAIDDGRLTLLVEWDRGTEGRARLARKLRHYVGWGDSPAADQARALVITTTVAREALVHQVVAELARRQERPLPPLATATSAAIGRHGPLGAIWWTVGEAGRRPPCVNLMSSHAT